MASRQRAQRNALGVGSASPLTLRALWGADLLPEALGDFKCPRESCALRGSCVRTASISSWPRVLAISLKRSAANARTGRFRKLQCHVAFELFLALPDAPAYELASLIVHTGAAGGGHYTAYVRSPSGTWLLCDDAAAPVPVTEARVLAAEAYMLFYKRPVG